MALDGRSQHSGRLPLSKDSPANQKIKAHPSRLQYNCTFPADDPWLEAIGFVVRQFSAIEVKGGNAGFPPSLPSPIEPSVAKTQSTWTSPRLREGNG